MCRPAALSSSSEVLGSSFPKSSGMLLAACDEPTRSFCLPL